MRVLSTIRFTVNRMRRNYIVLLLLLVVPIVLLTVFHFILGEAMGESGQTFMQDQSVMMVLLFQLFAGVIVMDYIHSDFFTPFRKRLFMAPFNKTLYAFSILMGGTLFSVLLGIILMIFTHFVLDVSWVNWIWSIYIIILMAVLSSIICLIFVLSVKKISIAERLSEVYGVGFVLLAGLFFPMPDNAFFDFMSSYGNPLTLSVMSIEAMNESDFSEAWFTANILHIAIVVLFIVMMILGRKKIS